MYKTLLSIISLTWTTAFADDLSFHCSDFRGNPSESINVSINTDTLIMTFSNGNRGERISSIENYNGDSSSYEAINLYMYRGSAYNTKTLYVNKKTFDARFRAGNFYYEKCVKVN